MIKTPNKFKRNKKTISPTTSEEKKIDSGEIVNAKYKFKEGMNYDEKFKIALEWWDDRWFHLKFAVRSADLLNEMLDHSLHPETLEVLYQAEKVGIPFFVNPYYLSLLNI